MKPEHRSKATETDGIRNISGRLVIYALSGFAFGYVVLHPISMLIFRWLDVSPGGMQAPVGPSPGLLSPIIHSFHLDMLPMAIVFGLFSTAMSVLDGLRRSALARRGDQLAQQLLVNEQNRVHLRTLVSKLRLKNSQLRRLERTNRRSTQFMVHDLKNNLHCINGFAELMIRRGGESRDPDDVDFLKRICRQCKQMKNSVMDLLDIARLNEKSDLRRQPYSATRLLREVAEDLQLSYEGYRIELGDQHHDCPEILVDPRLINRVLVNLAVNGVRHNKPGTKVTLDAEPDPNNGGVLLTCMDNGRGISTDLLPTLFDEFVTDGENAPVESTGLGLAFCRTAVAAHGGSIRVDTEVGAGASFQFTVPVNTDSPSEVVQEQLITSVERTNGHRSRRDEQKRLEAAPNELAIQPQKS